MTQIVNFATTTKNNNFSLLFFGKKKILFVTLICISFFFLWSYCFKNIIISSQGVHAVQCGFWVPMIFRSIYLHPKIKKILNAKFVKKKIQQSLYQRVKQNMRKKNIHYLVSQLASSFFSILFAVSSLLCFYLI